MNSLTIIPDPEEQSSPVKYPSEQRVDVDPQSPLRIKMVEMSGRLMALYTVEGAQHIGSLILNKCGNKCLDGSADCVCDRTYTFVFPNYYEVMLPIPALNEGTLFFRIGKEDFGGYLVDKNGNQLNVSARHVGLRLDCDGTITISDLSNGSGTSLSFHDYSPANEQSNGNGSGTKRFDQSVLGLDANFEGRINGDRSVAAFTARELREPFAVESKYSRLNEDSVAVNYALGNIVVADGLGGAPHGEGASSIATRWIAHSREPFKQAIRDAHEALRVFNCAVTFLNRSDTVFVAAKLNGDKVDFAHTGDCGWILVRNGKIEKRSDPDTALFVEMKRKNLGKRDVFLDEKLWEISHIVCGTLGSQFNPNEMNRIHYAEDVGLLEGDVLILHSDGAGNLSDDEIERSVINASPGEVTSRLKYFIKQKNLAACYLDDFGDGGAPIWVPSLRDNVSIAVYRH